MKNIKANIDTENEQIKYANGGYDHAFLLNDSENIELYDKISGRKMTVSTDAPAVVFYNSTQMDEDMELTGGVKSQKFLGVCLETQNIPNAVNFDSFKSPVLKTGETFTTKTVYKFTVEK